MFNPSRSSSLAIVLALVCVALGRAVTHDFVEWDDPATIANNKAINPPTLRSLATYWHEPVDGLYAPLTYTLWGGLGLVAHVDQPDEFGSTLNPAIYHLANLVIHLATVGIVFLILRRLTNHVFAALLGAAVIGLHPVQMEAVAWASGMKDVLCGLLIAVSLYEWIRYRDVANETGHAQGALACSVVAMLLACLAKPTGIVAAPMALAFDLIWPDTKFRRSWGPLAPMFFLAAVFVVIGRLSQPPLEHDLPALWIRPLIAGDALAFYLWKILWPAHLAFDYGRMPAVAAASRAFYFAWIVPISVAVIAHRVRRRLPLGMAGLLIALCGVAPVLGFVPFTFQSYSTVADHYLYPAMIGVAMLIAALVMRFDSRWIRAAGIVVVLMLTLRSFIVVRAWLDTETLAAQALSVNPRSFAAHTIRGMNRLRRHQPAEAEADLRQAIQINPDAALAHNALVGLLVDTHRPDEAVAEFGQVIRIFQTQRNYDRQSAADAAMGFAAQLQHRGDWQQAIDVLDAALHRDPSNAKLQSQLQTLQKGDHESQ